MLSRWRRAWDSSLQLEGDCGRWDRGARMLFDRCWLSRLEVGLSLGLGGGVVLLLASLGQQQEAEGHRHGRD